MKFKHLFTFLLFCCILFPRSALPGTGKEDLKMPEAFLPIQRYEFSPVVDGTQVRYNFVIRNKGTAPLKIEKVRTG